MREKINKNLYRAILILSFLAANALIIFGISSVWGFLNTGADRSTMLHTEIKSTRLYLPEIEWDTTNYEGRPMEKQSLAEIEKDYLNSWYVRNLSLETNKAFGIEDYYTDSARVNIYKMVDFNKENNISFKSTTISHQPELKFYSADGQLVVFNDHNVVEYSEAYENDELLERTLDTASYQVMMLLEDGFWRIRHMIRQEQEKLEKPEKGRKDWHESKGPINFEGKDFYARGINYYPKESPWDMFGENFDAEVIEDDFKILKSAGLNSIRIFIQYEDFGKAAVIPEKIDKLKKTLDIAEKYDLKVLVTLFDFYGDYSVLDWTLTHEHARQVVNGLKDHPALLGWDIKNEPDLDFDSRGRELVLNWLENMIRQVRKADPDHLVTIGWSNAESARLLSDKVDFVSFHYYQDPEKFPEVYSELVNETLKPVLLGEYGISSYDGFWNPFGSGRKGQAEYHELMQTYFSEADVSFMSWTLYDFEEVPSSVVGSLPWRKSRQKYFGFIATDGNKKESFKYIAK